MLSPHAHAILLSTNTRDPINMPRYKKTKNPSNKDQYRKNSNKKHQKETLRGVVRTNRRGVGFFENENKETIRIENMSLNTALHGDTVEVRILSKGRNDEFIGEVIKVLERKRLDFVGTVEKKNDIYFVIPQDVRVYRHIAISDKHLLGAKNGQKVCICKRRYRRRQNAASGCESSSRTGPPR